MSNQIQSASRAAGTPAISARWLTKSFPGVRAVDGLSIDVRAGEIFGLVGPDGAGKTTTLRMLAGIMAPDAGQATVDGHNVVRDPEGAKHSLSYMPQRFGLYEDLTVDENIRFYADLFGVNKGERTTRSTELLEAAGMSEFRARMAGKLSGGMKQKLGLVCALIHRPKVILLDEPTTGVDPVSRRDFWRILYELVARGRGHSDLDCLPGRSRALPSRCADAPRQAFVLRYAGEPQGRHLARACSRSPRPSRDPCERCSNTRMAFRAWC